MWKSISPFFPEGAALIQAFLAFFVPYVISKIWEKLPKKSKYMKYTDSLRHSTSGFTGDYTTDLELVRKKIGQNADVRFHTFLLGNTDIEATLIFAIGSSDKELIEQQILKPLMMDFWIENSPESFPSGKSAIEFAKSRLLFVSELSSAKHLEGLLADIWQGSTALFIQGSREVLVLGTGKGKSRSIEEPLAEPLVRGPRLGFNENLVDNITILRQLGETDSLTILPFQVGLRSRRDLIIAYIADIADPNVVREVSSRIEKIDVDHIPDTGYVEQLIEESSWTLFPQLQNTERPDRVMSALMEGRVAILLDGSPFALIVPVTFNMFLQSPDDYYERWIPGTLIRMLRVLAAFISMFGPSLYIAFISFHQGLIPTKLAMSIAGTREGVPFPSIIEALIMEVSIEILREAGLRLPKPIGQAIGIVGGLVIGQAAVEAGIVSPIMVIVVAVTAISSFTIPQYSAGMTLRILRFAAMFFAAILGLFGVILFFLLICSHLVKLKSFGVPYTSPAAPYQLHDWKDFIVRIPIPFMKRRPKMMHAKDKLRKG